MATVRIQVRRGTASQWTSANPTLAAGELGVESDTNLFKFGNGSTAWTSLAYANNSDVAIGEISQDAINTALTMGAGLTKTYNDGANTITITVDSSVVALKSYVDSAVSAHESDTTSVHGIADTAALATKTYADTAVSTHNDDTTNVHGIADTAALATKTYADTAVSTHNDDTTNVHGIADTSILVTTTGSQTLTTKSLTSPTLTGTPVAPTATAGTDTTQIATTAFVQDAIELVVGAAPSALNTLAEIATSLADNADLSGTLTTSISNKVAKAGDTMSGALNMGTNKITNLGVPTVGTDASTKAYADGLVENSITSHTNTSLNVHGISNTANLVYTADTRLSDERTPQPGSVSTAKIADLAVTTEKINDSAVTAAKIAAGAVETSELADLAVTTAKVADSAVTAGKIADSAIIAAKLGVGAVETAALADLAVTAGKIADSAVTAAKILDGAVGTSELADSAVTAAKILDGTVTGAKIAANAIAQSHLGDDSVGTNEIGGLAVTTGKIADTAVTTAKINDAAITSDKLAALAVVEGKIADGAVTTGKIADGAIVNSDINVAAEIATSKIAGLDTALGLLAPLASPTFTGTVTLPAGTITSGMILDGTIVDADINASAAIAQSKVSGLTSDLANKLASSTAASTYAPLASPTLTGTVTTGHILPATDVTFDLGSPLKMWRDIYVGPGSLYVNGQKVLQTDAGDVVITADANENLALRTSGSGNIELDPTGAGTVNIKGPLVIEAAANITSADGNGINFGSTINSDAITSKSLNTDLSLSGNGTGKVYLNDNAEVNGNLVVGGNLTVSGTTTTVNSETISLADNIIDLNSNFTTGTPTENAGIKIKRGDSSDVQIRWNESTDKWEFTNNGTDFSELAPIASPTFTGTVSGITSAMVGLGNVNNTSDAGKPVSTATQTALDLKANLASPTFTGTNTVANITVSGTSNMSANGVQFSDGTQTKMGVASLTAIKSAVAGNTTLDALGTDANTRDTLVPINGAFNVSFEATGNAKYAIGASISFYQALGTGGNITGNGITILSTPGATLRALYSSVTATKIAATTWLLAGDLKV